MLIRQLNTQQLSFLLAGLLYILYRFSLCVYMVYNFPKSYSCCIMNQIENPFFGIPGINGSGFQHKIAWYVYF